jgi:hypothetical protein
LKKLFCNLNTAPANALSILAVHWILLSWADVMTDGQLAYLSWYPAPLWAHDQIFLFPFFCRTIALLFILGCPLWWEDGSVICSAICQWSESRRTHNYTLLSHLRLVGSISVASYDSQGLRLPHREVCFIDVLSLEVFVSCASTLRLWIKYVEIRYTSNEDLNAFLF